MNREKIFLIEFTDGGDITECMNLLTQEGQGNRIIKTYGYKIHKIISSDGKVITQYNHQTGRTDLEAFRKIKEFRFVNVAKNKYNKFYWLILEVKGFETFKEKEGLLEVLYIQSQREASPEEAKELDGIFPGYFEKCY